MTTESPGLWGRLFGKRRKAAEERSVGGALSIGQATVGLCFDYERGVAFVSEYLSDVGLERVLEILRQHKLRATFNCPAKLCETIPDRLRMIASAGHELGVLGYADESPRELTDDAIKQLVYTCRNAFAKLGQSPIGFHSPHSHWDQRLCEELARQRFRYSAEHDHAKRPYVLVPGPPSLVRIPLSTDDRGLLRREETVNKTVSKHHRRLRQAAENRHFVSICFHPWILAEEKERMHHWEEWLQTAIKYGAKIGALADALPVEEPSEGAADR